jgi:sortase family protein
LGDAEWRRIAGFRVVMAWSGAGPAPPAGTAVSLRARIAGALGVLLILSGATSAAVAIIAQVHAPQPAASAAGRTATSAGGARTLRRSLPVSVDIPAIGVHSQLLHLGVNADGTMRVPSLTAAAGHAAWYKYSPTPGQSGVSVIEGHVDTYQGPAVFFRLGALHPGDRVDVRLADGLTAIFRVTGVREYVKSHFPARSIYRRANHAVLILITCGGAFDYATHQYLSSTVAFASLASSRRSSLARAG